MRQRSSTCFWRARSFSQGLSFSPPAYTYYSKVAYLPRFPTSTTALSFILLRVITNSRPESKHQPSPRILRELLVAHSAVPSWVTALNLQSTLLNICLYDSTWCSTDTLYRKCSRLHSSQVSFHLCSTALSPRSLKFVMIVVVIVTYFVDQVFQ